MPDSLFIHLVHELRQAERAVNTARGAALDGALRRARIARRDLTDFRCSTPRGARWRLLLLRAEMAQAGAAGADLAALSAAIRDLLKPSKHENPPR